MEGSTPPQGKSDYVRASRVLLGNTWHEVRVDTFEFLDTFEGLGYDEDPTPGFRFRVRAGGWVVGPLDSIQAVMLD